MNHSKFRSEVNSDSSYAENSNGSMHRKAPLRNIFRVYSYLSFWNSAKAFSYTVKDKEKYTLHKTHCHNVRVFTQSEKLPVFSLISVARVGFNNGGKLT